MGNASAKEAIAECCDSRTFTKIAEVLRVRAEESQGGSSGTGLVVSRIPSGPDEGRLIITNVILQGAAARQTMLQTDDIIIKLDGIATGHLNAMPGTPSPLLGHCGSTVSLQILRPSTQRVFSVTVVRAGESSPDEQMIEKWNEMDVPAMRQDGGRMFHSSSTIENHPPLRPIRSPVLGGVDDMSLFDITEENPADISMTPHRLGAGAGPRILRSVTKASSYTSSNSNSNSNSISNSISDLLEQPRAEMLQSYREISENVGPTRVPPPRKGATGIGCRRDDAPPPMPPPYKGARNVERIVSAALQPLDHNAPSAPGRLSLLPKHDKPQGELILVTPRGRSASQNDNKQQGGVVVIPFRPIDGAGGEAGGVENKEPERGDEQPKRDNAGRILRPTGQTLRRTGSTSGFKSYAMDRILRTSTGGEVLTPRGTLPAAGEGAKGAMIAEGYIMS